MSILKNKRKISQYQYEISFAHFYKFVSDDLLKVPKRYKSKVSDPIMNILNKAYSDIMSIRTDYYWDNAYTSRTELFNSAIQSILKLQSHFYILWNLMNFDDQKIQHYCNLANASLNSLCLKLDTDYNFKMIMYYKKDSIKKAKFLNNISVLHKYTHGKIAHAKKIYSNRECSLLSDFIDDAFYHCMCANEKIPQSKEDYLERKECR